MKLTSSTHNNPKSQNTSNNTETGWGNSKKETMAENTRSDTETQNRWTDKESGAHTDLNTQQADMGQLKPIRKITRERKQEKDRKKHNMTTNWNHKEKWDTLGKSLS